MRSLPREVRHQEQRVEAQPTASWILRLSEKALPHSCAMTQQPVAMVPGRQRTPATRPPRELMGWGGTRTPQPTVMAVEMAAYIRDLAVS